MLRLFTRLFAVLVALVLGCGWATAAWAEDGGKTDPSGDVFDQDEQKRGAGNLDVTKVSHTDDGETITYTLTTREGFGTDINAIHWYIEGPGLEPHECVPVAVQVHPKGDHFEAKVARCHGPDNFETLAAAGVTHANGSSTLVVSFPLAALRKAGMTSDRYTYTVWASESSRYSDTVPNDGSVTHVLSPPGTPRPVAPVVTAAPNPTIAPTAEPTATPKSTVAPAPTQTPDEAAGFSAPEESTDDGEQSTPLRVAAIGSVVAGAGVALLALRSF